MQFGHSGRGLRGRETARRTLLRPVWPRNLFNLSSLADLRPSWTRVDDASLLSAVERHAGEVIVALTFIVVSTVLILKGDGVPYVMDNNETFSSLNHAHNLWTFDFFRSYGLTDEAISPNPAAHPVVHSHQGNFPRLFAFLIYVLGARSAESQIWITTLTIGTASVLTAHAFLRRLAGELFATVALIFLITDYLMFAQWQVNTYRVWHCFFFFGALLSVHGYSDWKQRNWAIVTFLLYVSLFYWEFVFALFTAITAALYTFWVCRRRWRAIICIGLVQAAGATTAVALLALQLILYLGWDDFLTDLTLTVTARNHAPDNPSFIATLKNFYDSRNIVFFYNMQSDATFASLREFLRSLFSYVFQVASPLLSLLGIALAASALISDRHHPGPKDIKATKPIVGVVATIWLTSGIYVLLIALSDKGKSLIGGLWSGLPGTTASISTAALVCVLASFVIAIGLRYLVTRISLSGAPPRFGRSLVAAAYMSGFGLIIIIQGELYIRASGDLWMETLAPIPAPLVKIIVLTTLMIGGLVILAGRSALLGRWQRVPSSVAPFLICGTLSYLAIYILSAGYLHSGYLYRNCPLPIFVFDVLLALGFFVLVATSLTMVEGLKHGPRNWQRAAVAGVATCCISAFAFVWFYVQSVYVTSIPPDQLKFAKLLKRPDFKTEGLVSNTYSVPFGLAANTWAYGFVPRFLDAQMAAGGAGQSLTNFPYLWLADRRSNLSYLRPGLYVCSSTVSTMNRVLQELGGQVRAPECSMLDMLGRRFYESGQRDLPRAEILERDEVRGRWAIVRLIWPPPP